MNTLTIHFASERDKESFKLILEKWKASNFRDIGDVHTLINFLMDTELEG